MKGGQNMNNTRGLRIGKIPLANSSAPSFWSLKDGETAQLTILVSLDEVVSVDQYALWDFNPAPVWVSCGSNDPGVELGLKPTYRAYIPVAKLTDGVEEVKIWSVGIGIHRQLADVSALADGMKGLIIRVRREGSGLKTRYTIVSTGKRASSLPLRIPTVADICAMLGPETRDEIIALIEARTGQTYSRIQELYKPSNGVEEMEVEEVEF
jgi:hypothetical protein